MVENSFWDFTAVKEPLKFVYKTRKVELETEDNKAPFFSQPDNIEFYETYLFEQSP